MIKKTYILIASILILGHIQLEFGTWYYRWIEKGTTRYINPFIDKKYKWYDERGVPLEWWIKYVSEDFLWIATYGVLMLISKKYSYKLFLISSVFFTYHLFDHVMLWVNYRTSWWIYIVELADCLIAAIVIFFIKEKKRAIIKSII